MTMHGFGGEPRGAFTVDLRGLVDLLAQHLYSSPRVYLRELLQNAVDACVQRATSDARPAVRLLGSDLAEDGRMHCFDSGVGLDAEDVVTFLATIGRSSKRDELGLARTDRLGQFGIGLLSAFMVSDSIEVVSRTGEMAGDGTVVQWIGRADGSYWSGTVRLAEDDLRLTWLAKGPGTCVTLTPRPHEEHWLTTDTLVELASVWGGYLPQRVEVVRADCATQIAPHQFPWRLTDQSERRQQVRRLGTVLTGAEPFAAIPVAVPASDLTGVVYVLGRPSHGATRPGARLYLKGMLVGEDVGQVMPEWASFGRLVAASGTLRPTASREGLYEDDLLEETRREIGRQIRNWLLRLAGNDPARGRAFLDLHGLAVKAMALGDDEVLDAVLPLLVVETNSGWKTLAEVAQTTDVVHVTASVQEFRQTAQIGAAQGLDIVNGGYVHDRELVMRAAPRLGLTAYSLELDGLDAHIAEVPADRLREVAVPMETAVRTLDRLDCDVELRRFAPASLPALYLHSGAAMRRREARHVSESVDDLWAAVLGGVRDEGNERPRLLLNDANDLVQRLWTLDEGLVATVVESLYTRALLQGQHPLRPADRAALDRSFSTLLDHATEMKGRP